MRQRPHLEKLLFWQLSQTQCTPRLSSISKPAIFPRQLAQNIPAPRLYFTFFSLDDILILTMMKIMINIIITDILNIYLLLTDNCVCCTGLSVRSERNEGKFADFWKKITLLSPHYPSQSFQPPIMKAFPLYTYTQLTAGCRMPHESLSLSPLWLRWHAINRWRERTFICQLFHPKLSAMPSILFLNLNLIFSTKPLPIYYNIFP